MRRSFLLPIAVGVMMISSLPALAAPFDWEKAVSLYKQGQYRAAITEFKQVVAEFPNHSDSWKFIGLAHYQLQEYKEALPALRKALDLKQAEGKSDPDILLAISRSQISLRQYDEALPALEKLARERPAQAANHYMLGVAYANLNRSEEAVASFKTAAKLQPGDADTLHFLSIQQVRLGRTSDAIATLRQGVAASPKHAEMLALLADMLLRQGANEVIEARAMALNEEAIRTASALRAVRDDATAAELLGRANLAAKKYAPAEQALARAVTLSKEPSPVVYFNLGLAQAQLKAWTRALDSFIAADKLKPNDVNTLYYLGFVYENLRRYPQALDAYTRAYQASGQSNEDLKASIDRVTPFAKSP